MRCALRSKSRQDAQTLVFFLLSFGAIILLCGLAIDSGLLYLSKARLSRAVDGAALAAVGNFHRDNDPATNRDDVAVIMRNFAVANFTDLGTGPAGGISTLNDSRTVKSTGSYLLPTGQTAYTYTYIFNDGTTDANGWYKRFVQVVLNTGSGGSITSATCNSRCPVHTYFINYAGSYFRDLKVSASAVATRNPRLIMIVLDRSASMLAGGGGAYGLPQSVVTFLNFFDTSSDDIGIVSFGTSARLEMPLTTNFITAGTNLLFDAYQIDGNNGAGVPGADPEQFITNGTPPYEVNYAYSGVRRFKFGGQTSADDGIRLALEQMMANGGFNDPDVVKYVVLFTDGKWNTTRTLLAAPGYTNVVFGPVSNTNQPNVSPPNYIVSSAVAWSTNMASNVGILPVPTLSPMPYVTNAIMVDDQASDFSTLAPYHYNDYWQSIDGKGQEPLSGSTAIKEGAPDTITNNTYLGQYTSPLGLANYYTKTIDVWLPPGSVDYVYTNGGSPSQPAQVYVSDLANPTQHVSITLNQGDSNALVVPGYVADGLFYDGLDLTYPDDPNYPKYRLNNFNEFFMWPDDGTPFISGQPFLSTSLQRQLLFRNYANLLTGFYVNRADEPLGASTNGYITETPPGAQSSRYGLGAYYPASGFYWPFGSSEPDLSANLEDGPVGNDYDPTYALTNATEDPDPNYNEGNQGGSRHAAYSINMLSDAAAPEWYGELFYKGTPGGGTSVYSGNGTTSVSSVMSSSSDWLSFSGTAPKLATWINAYLPDMTSDPTHNSNITPNPKILRPYTFQGTEVASTLSGSTIQQIIANNPSTTGGYVTRTDPNDPFGVAKIVYKNSMAWVGRPTHYFDFSTGQWVAVAYNHVKNVQSLPLGYWKAREYAWHARALGVKFFTVGYGSKVSPEQQVVLAQIANSTNTTAGNTQTWDGNNVSGYVPGVGTAITYNPNQPIGQQFYATTTNDISNDFYQVGTAINAALTQ